MKGVVMKAGARKIRILHVDDEKDTLEVVKVILEREGFEVVSVNLGKTALHQIKLDGFDLIILDIMMPDMSGWELFSKLGDVKKKYKVIFLSILELTEDKLAELKKSGIVDYIRKPFDRDYFVSRVRKAIAENR